MKKLTIAIMALFVCLFCSACNKKDNILNLSKSLNLYEITINLDCETKQATASETFFYTNSTGQVLKDLKFHLYPQNFKEGATSSVVPSTHLNQAYPNGMDYALFNVDRITLKQADIPVQYLGDDQDILQVNLPNSLLPDECVQLTIDFSFTLANCQHRFGYGENTINLGNFYPVLCVFENGEFNTTGYHQNGDPFYSQMANYDVVLTFDQDYTLASTGEILEQNSSNNKTTTRLKANLVRDFAMVLSNEFETAQAKVNNTNVNYFYFNDENFERSLKTATDALSTFSKLFGAYPYKTFNVVQTDFVYGGMEYPNLIMVSADIPNLDDYLNVIVHETAHQWWYGMVGNDEFKYPWLDEALTEFSTLLFYDHNKGYNLNHTDMVKASAENYTLFVTVYQDVLGTLDTSMRAVNEYNTEPEYTYCTYVKGMLMYESLYQLIGKNAFVSACKTYFQNNKYQNATPEKLICAFEKATKKD